MTPDDLLRDLRVLLGRMEAIHLKGFLSASSFEALIASVRELRSLLSRYEKSPAPPECICFNGYTSSVCPVHSPPAPSAPVDGYWPKGDLGRWFVDGAKWWEFESRGATMWPSDRNKAEAEAERRLRAQPPAPPPVEKGWRCIENKSYAPAGFCPHCGGPVERHTP